MTRPEGMSAPCGCLPSGCQPARPSGALPYPTVPEPTLRPSGTVFGSSQRVVEFEGHKLEFEPKGYMLVYKSIDKPGVLSRVSGLLGENKINIQAPRPPPHPSPSPPNRPICSVIEDSAPNHTASALEGF